MRQKFIWGTALAAALLFGSGIATGLVWFAPISVPENLAPPVVNAEEPVTVQKFDDRRSVDLSLSRFPESTLTVPSSGRVTKLQCGSNPAFISGGSNISIDSKQILNLATEPPLWRDLTLGAEGSDVHGLQNELRRLGYTTPEDGVFNRATLRAVRAAFADIGYAESDAIEALSASDVLWLPEPTTTVEQCLLSLGATVVLGDKLATVPGGLSGVVVSTSMNELAEGNRLVVVDDISVPLEMSGAVTDANSLKALAATSTYILAERTSEKSMAGSLVLADPINVLVVSPAALYDISGKKACLWPKNSLPIAVVIVSSELGKTYVFPEAANEQVTAVNLQTESAPKCR